MEHLTFFLSDNGGEFNNELSREIGKQLNINIKTTAAESLWFNGIVENYWERDGKSDVGRRM